MPSFFFELGHIDDRYVLLESGVRKSFLRQATVDRHLTTFKARANTTTGTGFLTFVATTTCFTKAGTFTFTQTLGTVLRAWARFQIVKSHEYCLL